MLLRQVTFTVHLQESGYLLAVDDESHGYPAAMPYGWRCGPATPSSAVILATTDTGPVTLILRLHDTPPPPDNSTQWEPVEELSLRPEGYAVRVLVLGSGDVSERWPVHEAPLQAPEDAPWVRLRLHCRAEHSEPGLGDRGERHLVQLWPAPPTPPVHPPLAAADIRARATYEDAAGRPVEEYTRSYTVITDCSGNDAARVGRAGRARSPAVARIADIVYETAATAAPGDA
ncbi:hypothetical protein AB0L41_34800 [Amycolatopsis mediterranei]|uniref:hypothetical protein n=1 Tax=Amycolatopsis mediterranei TaxID=33910 RepID=UPI00342B74FA